MSSLQTDDDDAFDDEEWRERTGDRCMMSEMIFAGGYCGTGKGIRHLLKSEDFMHRDSNANVVLPYL